MDVLKRELVQVQTLMDNMTREREEESVRLKNEYEQLQRNFTTSEVRLLHSQWLQTILHNGKAVFYKKVLLYSFRNMAYSLCVLHSNKKKNRRKFLNSLFCDKDLIGSGSWTQCSAA